MNFSRAASLTHDPGRPSGARSAAPVMRLIPSMSVVLLAAQPVMVRVYHQRARWWTRDVGGGRGMEAVDDGYGAVDDGYGAVDEGYGERVPKRVDHEERR